MRLAIIQDTLRSGGTEQQALAIAHGLALEGVETHLIVFKSGGALEEKIDERSVRLHALPQGPLRVDWFAPGLHRLLESLQVDVALPMGRMANCHAGLLLGKRHRSYRVVATFRTGRRIPWLYRKALQRADAIVANSHEALRRLATDFSIDRPEASHVIHNGCVRDFETVIPSFAPTDRGQRASPPNAFHLVSVSMFRAQKRQDRLIRICAQLPETIDWRLTLAGEGPNRPSCQALAHGLGVAQRVSFPGLLKDPRSLYSSADVAVHASERESLPNFLVEAQMAGLPVVAYDVNGVSETFRDQSSGFLIPHGDEPAFLDALQTLFQETDLRLRMSESARDNARRLFSLESQTNAYFRLCESLLTDA
ncbi:glycosyltransferase [Pelagicoccus sp. SDUM812003]|uniref:glycosyltransferase n=1 Tax=Pelagicoccus sp. SDUM812003 TaxID=3041267 RepID=UPI00280F64B1|nr:glycosyltransferase [Pelagicoccus sp. SDUM812003]MDQ8203622.1 glycosyltransferase [Pelagicoccus sp. SDUM812003]